MNKKGYYDLCAIPKPKARKREHKTNGYKDKRFRVCYYCGTPYAERHEVYPGKNRQNSIDNGFQVDLCRKCHKEMQDNITERAKRRNEYWHIFYQMQYEEQLIASGIEKEKARELWIHFMGKNYIDD